LRATAIAGTALLLPRRITAQLTPAKPRKVVITIDDGPATGATRDLQTFQRISRSLREAFTREEVPVIMFVNERQLHVDGERDARIAVVQEWLDAGLELGNHTYSHVNLGAVGGERFMDDIVKGEVISRALLESRGKKLVWFRYPFLASGTGETAENVEKFLAERGYKIAPVSVDYHDYSFASTYARMSRAGDAANADAHFALVMKALDEAFDRAERKSVEVLGYELPQCLLIHCNEMNALTLRATLGRIRDRGYTFVSIDEAMQDPAYHVAGMRPGGMGGGGFFNSVAAAKR
jgi:peptidoglycan/xylan/chitin deacetylase (PgdA/CDA1 family)